MTRASHLLAILVVSGVVLLSASFPTTALADAKNTGFVSRDAEIGAVKLRYVSGGHGPPLVLLHGYAETSRKTPGTGCWRNGPGSDRRAPRVSLECGR